MHRFDSGLLLTTDFRKTFVSRLQNENDETKQISQALTRHHYTKLNDDDKLLLAHDLSFIFSKEFYDFDKGCLKPEMGRFFRSDETLIFFADYLQYFSFISSYHQRPAEADSILNDISSLESRKKLFQALREPLSPYLFVTFIHNLIDTINLGSSNNDPSSIENEMCRQLMINAKELSQMDKFIELHKTLLEKVKNQYRKVKKTVSKEMENNFSFYFAHAFYQTIIYPSDKHHSPSFELMTKEVFKKIQMTEKEMKKLIDQFSYEKDFLSYLTYLYQRALSIGQKNLWIHPVEEKETFLYPAQLRLTIMSKKIGELIGDESQQPIGNTVFIVIIPIDQNEAKKVTVNFQYNRKSYTRNIVDGLVDCVFPVFKDAPLEITFFYDNKKNKEVVVIPSLNEPAENEIMKQIKFGNHQIPVVFNYKFYSHDKPLENLIVHLNVNPKNLFDLVADVFIFKYLRMNKEFIYVNRGQCEDDEVDDVVEDNGDDDEDNDNDAFGVSLNASSFRVSQDISGRAFPVDYWLFLVDIAMRYSIPSSYFFSRLAEKLDKLWCTSQAYINMYCIIMYNLFFAINNSEHTKEEEQLLNDILNSLRDKCIHLLMNQLAKPEIYQRPSITSLILLLSLANVGDSTSFSEDLKRIFVSSMKNINTSVFNRLIFIDSDKECTSMELFNKVYFNKKGEFNEGPNHLPLCVIDVESMRNAIDLVLYRTRSISSFYLESFLPNFANIGDNIMNDLLGIAVIIAKSFNELDPLPDSKTLVYFVSTYQQLYQLFRKPPELNPAVIFNELIENWIYDMLNSQIELVERSVALDNFVKRSDKKRESDSIYEIFSFFKQGFNFITSLNFTPNELKDKLFLFLSLDSAICSTYIEVMLSLISKPFRARLTPPAPSNALGLKTPVKVKSPFPSWCPDITENRNLTFENICIIINNVSSIRLKWFQYIAIYNKYIPNQPQILKALKATEKKAVKDEPPSPQNLLLNENESTEEFVEVNNDTFKDPCIKLSQKVAFMMNFLRLDVTFSIIELLDKKMWDTSMNKMNIKQLREHFFADSHNRVDEDNIDTVFDHIFDLMKDRLQKVKDNLLTSMQVKCLPQLFRGLEEGIFECMIPMAFSTKSKNVFPIMTKKIDILFSDVWNYIEEAGFGKEIVNRCIMSLRLWPFVRDFMHLTVKEVDEEMKNQKSKFNGDYTYIILLSIIGQSVTPVPLPKAVNPNYTFINLD